MTPTTSTVLRVLDPQPAETTEASGGSGALLGLCVATTHPTLAGRVHVHWAGVDGAAQAAWLPQLHGVNAREGDRVLLTLPANYDEPVVTGVLDGIAEIGMAPPAEAGPVLQLRADEALRIAGPDGQPLVEVKTTEAGPEVRLFAPPAALSFPGSFRVSADQIEFEARKGEVLINAAGDIKVVGEIIRLN